MTTAVASAPRLAEALTTLDDGRSSLLVQLLEQDRRIAELERALSALSEQSTAKDRRIAELERVVSEKDEENAEIKSKLRFYENPNTPPSQQRFKRKKEQEPGAGPKKRGAPVGHRGATRATPVPTRHVRVEAGACPQCGSRRVRETDGTPEKRVRTDIQETPEPTVTEFECPRCECMDCGCTFTAAHPECPQEGAFGVNVIVATVMLTYGLRGVMRRVAEHLGSIHGFPITATSIHNILRRVGEACKGEYERTRRLIAQAPYKYIDETSFAVLTMRFWLWVFRSPDGHVLIAIRHSRGAKVLEEILGKMPTGIGVSDGWKAYNVFAQLQRCWAHLLRKVDDVKDASEWGGLLSERLHRMFKELRDFLDRDPPMEERLYQKEVWEREMEALVLEFEKHTELHEAVTYMRNGLGSWYTCVAHPGMEPTNNLAEQTIREGVMWRKIIGCFRSTKGAENYQYIASLIATWRLQGKDMYAELRSLLSRELCLKARA